MQNLEFRRIRVITPRHSEIAQNELREKREIEADENYQRRKFSPPFRIEPAEHLRPPEVKAAQVRHHHPADHDVMKMRDDKIRIVNMNIDPQRGEEQPGHSADRKQ